MWHQDFMLQLHLKDLPVLSLSVVSSRGIHSELGQGGPPCPAVYFREDRFLLTLSL